MSTIPPITNLADIPAALIAHYGTTQSTFITQQGIFASAFTRAVAIILAQGKNHDAYETPLIKLLSLYPVDAVIHLSTKELMQHIEASPKAFQRLQSFFSFVLIYAEKTGMPISHDLVNTVDSFSTNNASSKTEAVLESLSHFDTQELLELLFRNRGIGSATAESLVSYVFNHQFIPVNAGLYRIANRHGYIPEQAEGEEIREFYASFLPNDPIHRRTTLFLLQKTAQFFCKTTAASCTTCPIGAMI